LVFQRPPLPFSLALFATPQFLFCSPLFQLLASSGILRQRAAKICTLQAFFGLFDLRPPLLLRDSSFPTIPFMGFFFFSSLFLVTITFSPATGFPLTEPQGSFSLPLIFFHSQKSSFCQIPGFRFFFTIVFFFHPP